MQYAIGLQNRTIFKLNRYSFIRTFHKESSWWSARSARDEPLWLELSFEIYLCRRAECEAYLTSFILEVASRYYLQGFMCGDSPGLVLLLSRAKSVLGRAGARF